jgi:hypothetical protein
MVCKLALSTEDLLYYSYIRVLTRRTAYVNPWFASFLNFEFVVLFLS